MVMSEEPDVVAVSYEGQHHGAELESRMTEVRCKSCRHLVNILEMSECTVCSSLFCGRASNDCKAVCDCD